MLTFKQYIAEKWVRGIDSGPGAPRVGRRHYITHTDNVGGNSVDVSFHKEVPLKDRSAYSPIQKHKKNSPVSVDFKVNYSYDDEDKPINTKGNLDILHHVHRVISHYIRKQKPEYVQLTGNTSQKRKMYAAYARHLARQTGGEVRVDRDHPNAQTIKYKGGE